MDTDIRVFKTYAFKTEAEALTALLETNDIKAEAVEVSSGLDGTFSGDYQKHYVVKIQAADFGRANAVLEALAKEQIASVATDYYLFSTTDDELFDIVLKKDEWNEFDYQLAKKILADRGQPIDEKLIKSLNKRRIDDLAKEEVPQKGLIYAGYTFAFLGGILGVFIGYVLKDSKKTLPTGEEVYSYTEADREHGKWIFRIAVFMLIFWIFVQIMTIW